MADFTIFCGPMFSSKTSMLLMSLERYRHQKKSIIAFKPLIDTRYNMGAESANEIVSHGGWRYSATPVIDGDDLFNKSIERKVDVVAVDEAFMIPGCADALIVLFRSGINVLVSSIDLSSSCKPFKEVEKMMSWATKVEKCSAVCTMCGRNAYYTLKLSKNDIEIEVGGSTLYESRCADCHGEVLL